MNRQDIDSRPVTSKLLIAHSFAHHVIGYFLPPLPAHGGMYRVECRPTVLEYGSKDGPKKSRFEWQAYLTNPDASTIRTFKIMQEVKDFHKGMCGGVLVEYPALTMMQCLDGMMGCDQVLYERILDTQGFAYYFNQMALLAEEKGTRKPLV